MARVSRPSSRRSAAVRRLLDQACVQSLEARRLFAVGVTTLVTFDGTNGSGPYGGLVVDASGVLYGTTASGGTSGDGVVFQASASGGAPVTLATFDGTSGASPEAGLIADASGNLYGTTSAAGANGDGTVFELAKGSGTITTLASFDGTDGDEPHGGLLMDASGNLYGTTYAGGADEDGTVFEVAKNSGAITLLASFDGTDGAESRSDLVADASGNLYGTTYIGGAGNSGTAFEVAAGSHAITTLVSFDGTDGSDPIGGLVFDGSGNLYGTTYGGGASGDGTVYEIAAGTHALTTLASFSGINGLGPAGGLIADASGNFYGTTFGTGTAYEVSAGTHTITTLAVFNGTTGTGGSTGTEPIGALVADGSGNLYGATFDDAVNGSGTIFELTGSGFGGSTAAATITATPPAAQSAVAGTAKSFALGSFAETGATAPYTVSVSWGDGSADTTFTVSAAGTITPQSHTYAAAGTDTASVSVTDSAGHTSNAATFSATVSPATTTATVHVYDDPGQTGSTSTPLPGRTVFVDTNGDGILEAGEPSAVTGTDGSATLPIPTGAASEIAEVLPAGVAQSQPPTAEATVAGDPAGDPVNFFTKALSATAAQTGAFFTDYSLASLPATFETDAVAAQPDGKLLVAGTDRSGATPTAFVARFFADGEPDAAFGTGGIADGPADTVAANVVEEPDGTVYLASNGAGTAAGTAYVSGFTAAGAASSITPYTTPAGDASTVQGLTLSTDGTLLLAGTREATGASGVATAFLTDLAESTLRPTSTFGTAGTVVGTATNVTLIGPALVAPNGDLDLLAYPTSGGGLVLDTYSIAGALVSATPLAAAIGTGFTPASATIQSNGEIVVAGLGPSASGGDFTVDVARVTAAGAADTTFGTAGLVTEDDSSLLNTAGSLAICDTEVLPDGTILVTGKYDYAPGGGVAATYQCFCQEYTSTGTEELGYGQTNSLVVSTDTPDGVVGLAQATGVLPTVTATPTADVANPAFVDPSIGFHETSVPVPAMLTARGVADVAAETTAPTVAYQTPAVDPITSGSTPAQLQVAYTDPVAIDLQSVGTGNLQVTRPDGSTVLATFVGFQTIGNSQDLDANYDVAPAGGGAWTAADNGTYTVALLADQVRNTAVFAPANAALGTFTVDVGAAAGTTANTVTVTAAAATAKTGNLVPFTVTVASANTAVTAVPTGTVTFSDAAGALGTVTLSDGTATFATAALPAGSDAVTATYSGDGTYVASTTGTATVTETGPAAGAAVLTPSLAKATLPAAVVAGAKVKPSLPLVITNTGGATEKGTVVVKVYASTDAALDGTDTLLGTFPHSLTIKAGKAASLKLALSSFPASLAAGGYHLLAQVVDVGGFAQTAATTGTLTVAAPIDTPKLAFAKVTGPTALAAGGKAKGSAILTLTDGGNVALSGSVTVTLYLTAGGTVTAGSAPVVAVTRKVSVPAGKGKPVSVPLGPVPASTAAGTYTLVAVVTTPTVNGAPAASATAVDATAVTVTG